MKKDSSCAKIKNVIIVNDFDYVQGGASKVAIETANILSNNYTDISVYFFSAVHSDLSDLNDKVIKVSSNQHEALKDKNRIRGFFNGLYNFKVKRKMKNLLKTLEKDKTIIHVHGWTKALSSSVFSYPLKKGYKLALTMHDYFTACPNGGYYNYKKNEICKLKPMSAKCCTCNCDSRNYLFKIYRVVRQFVQNKIVKLNKKLSYVISISDFSEKILKKTLNPRTKIYRVYNPIDLDKNAKKIDYMSNEYYLFVGRVSQEKGPDIFCRAISELGLKGIMVGDGTELSRLKEKYPQIEYVGWKNNEEVKKYMCKAKALILPSRWYEGAPLTPLEAMQYGIPVITSNCNAAKDYILNGKNGYTYDDYSELIAMINKVNTKKMECKFSYNHDYCKDLIDCYEDII